MNIYKKDLKFMERYIKESLRLYPTVPVIEWGSENLKIKKCHAALCGILKNFKLLSVTKPFIAYKCWWRI